MHDFGMWEAIVVPREKSYNHRELPEIQTRKLLNVRQILASLVHDATRSEISKTVSNGV